MEFSRQEKWSGLPFSSSEELPNPGIEPWSPASKADSLLFELQGSLVQAHSSTLQMLLLLSRFSRVRLFATPRTVACQAHLSMGLPRQEYQTWLPFPPLEKPPDTGIKPTSLVSPALAREFFTTSTTWEANI